MSSFQGVLIRGVPAVLLIKVSSFQSVLIRGVTAGLLLSCYRDVLISDREVFNAHSFKNLIKYLTTPSRQEIYGRGPDLRVLLYNLLYSGTLIIQICTQT